jgi:hypothetical protein
MGVATSSVTFFRQMGGTLGVAVFLSVLFTVLPSHIQTHVADAQATPAYQQALSNNPQQAATLQSLAHGGGASAALSDTSFIQKLDHTLALPFKQGFSEGFDLIFLIAACVIAFGFVLMLFLPELPLRSHAGVQEREQAHSEAEAAVIA